MAFSIPIIGDLIEKGMDTVIRWKESSDKIELTREEFEMRKKEWAFEMKKFAIEQVQKPDSDFRKFVLEYEGSGDNVHPALQFLRGAVRPLITLWVFILITVIMLGWIDTGKLVANIAAIPDQLWNIFQIVIGFWFGGRVLQHSITEIAKGYKDKEAAKGQAEVEKERISLNKEKVRWAAQGMQVNDDLEEVAFSDQELEKAFSSVARKQARKERSVANAHRLMQQRRDDL